jgi:hypothetical protein
MHFDAWIFHMKARKFLDWALCLRRNFSIRQLRNVTRRNVFCSSNGYTVAEFLPRMPILNPLLVHVNGVELQHAYSEHFGFPCQLLRTQGRDSRR